MSKPLKRYLKQDLVSRLGDDRDVVVLQIDGFPVERANDLRNTLRSGGAHVTVLRNRVARLAFEELGMSGLGDVLDGMSAIAHGGTDGVLGVSRTVSEWTKKNKDTTLKVLGGFMEGRVISPADVETLATLPSREQLLAMIASAVVAPMQNVASQINELIAGVARAVDAVREQKEQQA